MRLRPRVSVPSGGQPCSATSSYRGEPSSTRGDQDEIHIEGVVGGELVDHGTGLYEVRDETGHHYCFIRIGSVNGQGLVVGVDVFFL